RGAGASERQTVGTSNRIFTQTYGEKDVPTGEGVEPQLLDNDRAAIRSGDIDPYSVLRQDQAARPGKREPLTKACPSCPRSRARGMVHGSEEAASFDAFSNTDDHKRTKKTVIRSTVCQRLGTFCLQRGGQIA